MPQTSVKYLLLNSETTKSYFECWFLHVNNTNNNIKAFTESMVSKLGNNFVCLCLSFEHTERGGFGAVQLESDTFGEIWFLQNLFVEEMID